MADIINDYVQEKMSRQLNDSTNRPRISEGGRSDSLSMTPRYFAEATYSQSEDIENQAPEMSRQEYIERLKIEKMKLQILVLQRQLGLFDPQNSAFPDS